MNLAALLRGDKTKQKKITRNIFHAMPIFSKRVP